MRLMSIGLVLATSLTTPAIACSPAEVAPARDAERAESALLVQVMAVELGPSTEPEASRPVLGDTVRIASYRVERLLKGSSPAELRFTVPVPPPIPRDANGIPHISWCGDWPVPRLGERWLLYHHLRPYAYIQAIALHSAEGQVHKRWWDQQPKTTEP